MRKTATFVFQLIKTSASFMVFYTTAGLGLGQQTVMLQSLVDAIYMWLTLVNNIPTVFSTSSTTVFNIKIDSQSQPVISHSIYFSNNELLNGSCLTQMAERC